MIRAERARVWAAFLFLACIALGFATRAGVFDTLDRALLAQVALRQGEAEPALIALWQWISWIGGGTQRYIIVVLLAVLLGWRGGWRRGVALAFAALFSNLASDGLKRGFDRARPDLVPHLDHVSSAAYPSGHATSAALVYVLFVLLMPMERRGWAMCVAVAAVLLSCWARLALGVHWPTDVVGGTLLGLAFALLAVSFARRASSAVFDRGAERGKLEK